MATTETVDVVMPQMGVSVSEGTITKWLKQEGDAVEADEPLLEISTDKVDTEVPSPGSGVVAQILVAEGETVDVGTKLAVIAPEGAEAPPQAEEPPAAPAAEEPEPEPVAEAPTPEREPATAPTGDGKAFVSPVVARIAAEHGVDASQVPGTGRGGRVTKKDILGFIEQGPPAEAPAPVQPKEEVAPPTEAPVEPPPTEAPAQPPPAKAEPAPAPARAAAAPAAELQPGEQEEPMTAMRRGIAEHMRRSLDTAAHVTSAIEVDMSRVVAAREKLKPKLMESHGVNPTYLVFVARAVVETLKDYPWINGEIRGDKIVTRNYVNLGFAVELEDGKGLIVPVVKNVQDLNLLGIARAVTDVAERARTKKLNPDEVQGGTFTITNPGGYGTFHGTPVISQPQAAILGTYALVKRPWVVQDEHGKDVIAIRPIMNLTLTYDHRLVDGALAGRFLRDLRARLESWNDTGE
jgi:2-oxoglutarate dehydrogenase dihydrolipoamide succinyltransferase (E2 component)